MPSYGRTFVARATLTFAASLAACSAPGPVAQTGQGLSTPPLTQPLFDTAGSPEPGLAVGENYVYALSSSSYRVFERAPDGSVIRPPKRANTNLDKVFNTLVLAVNFYIGGSPGAVLPCPYPENVASVDDNTVTPETTGCVGQPYDSDVIYDQKRDRFWIMTHLRNLIYPCTTTDNQRGYQTQYDILQGNSTCTPDPDQSHPPAHRIIAVAVTKGGENLGDPQTDFFVYGLVDEAGDWPQMMVHGDYLLLNHRERLTDDPTRPHGVYVFSADALANNQSFQTGNAIDGSLLEEQPVTTLTPSSFSAAEVDWNQSPPQLVEAVPDTGIFFVKQPYSTGGTTYLVAGSSRNLIFYGLPPLSGHDTPNLMTAGLIDAGTYVPMNFAGSGNLGNYVPGVWHDKLFYWAWPACASETLVLNPSKPGDTLVDCGSQRMFARAVRIPLWTGTFNGQSAVQSSNGTGWLSTTIGENDDVNDYALPVVGVNKNNDCLIEYSRYPVPSPWVPLTVRYQVMYHDQSQFNSSQEIDRTDYVGTRPDGLGQLPGRGGSIDTPSVVADPLSPSALWMSYGIPASPPPSPSPSPTTTAYKGIFTGVDIGPCAGDSNATDHFSTRMVGCGGHFAWAYSSVLCAPSYHQCSAQEWQGHVSAGPNVLPSASYWTSTQLDQLLTLSPTLACYAVPVGSGTTSCGTNPMHICDPNGTDAFGNTCEWSSCGYDLFSGNYYYGGCSSQDATAGALCCAD